MLLRVPELSAFLRVIEPETLDLTNLNRYALARRFDSNQPKAEILENYSRGILKISGRQERLDDSWPALLGSLAPRVLVGVDQIPVRWAVQRAAPPWLQVAGTSHFLAMASSHRPDGPCAGCTHPIDEVGNGPIPTISFVSLWAGILQALDLLSDASSRSASAPYAICHPFGLSGPRPMIRGVLDAAANCPVGCQASRSLASDDN